MEKENPADWKKLGYCLLFAILLAGVMIIYFELRPPQTEHVVMWSSDSDYQFAVDAPYDGDNFGAGDYYFYQDNVTAPGKAKAWGIYVSEKLSNDESELSDMQYIGVVGTAENKEVNINIPKGKYVYVKHRGGKDFEGSLEIELTPQ